MDPKSVLYKIVDGITKGAITPESVSVGGVLEVDVAARFIDLVVDQADFLKRITIHKTSKIKSTFKGNDIAAGSLVRVTEGSDPADGQKTAVSRVDVPFVNLPAQLFYQLLFSAIDDNKANPNFEADLETMFGKTFSNDLMLLGFTGTSDDYAGSTFIELNKGWPQVAKDQAPALQKVNTNGVVSFEERCFDVIKAMPDKYKQPGATTLTLSTSDWFELTRELGMSAASVLAQILRDGQLPQLYGYPFAPISQIASGTTIFSNLENYWMTMLTEIKRFREVRGTKRCIDYTFDVSNDYGFINPKAVVIGYDQGE